MDRPPHRITEELELAVEGTLAPDERALLRCRLAKRLEYSGEYEAACEVLQPFWPGTALSPDITGLGTEAAAELFLRAGVLTGWLGSKAQTAASQEIAKDLISRSLSLFEQAGLKSKADEARIELAYCYFRAGAIDEARVLLQDALKRLEDNRELLALATLRLAMVEGAATRFHDSLNILLDAATLFEASENHTIKGSYHNHLAYAFQSLGTSQNRADYFDRAIVEFTAASYHFQQSGHARYHAHVENNLGLLLHSVGKSEESHRHLDSARALFTDLGDNLYAAQVDDTRASVLLEQGKFVEAEEVAHQACQTFERVNAYNLLAEALTTRGKALARLGRLNEARADWEQAAEVAEQAGSLEVAGTALLTMCEEVGHLFGPEELRGMYTRMDSLLAASQSPEVLGRLRRVARHALTSWNATDERASRSTDLAIPVSKEATADLTRVRKLISEARRRHRKDVSFTADAMAAMIRLFLVDDMYSLSQLIEQSVEAAQSGAVVSADDVEVVAMRSRPSRANFIEPWAEFSLKEEIGFPEKRFIELALKAAKGKISVAARLLGLKHNERLTSIIKSRYPELLAIRTPPVSRRRSIIRKPK